MVRIARYSYDDDFRSEHGCSPFERDLFIEEMRDDEIINGNYSTARNVFARHMNEYEDDKLLEERHPDVLDSRQKENAIYLKSLLNEMKTERKVKVSSLPTGFNLAKEIAMVKNPEIRRELMNAYEEVIDFYM